MFGLDKDTATVAIVLALLAVAAMGEDKRPGRRRGKAPYPNATPGAPGSAREKWDPLGLRKKIEAAIATGDPQKMRELAQLLRAEGWSPEADMLIAAAEAAERARAGSGPR